MDSMFAFLRLVKRCCHLGESYCRRRGLCSATYYLVWVILAKASALSFTPYRAPLLGHLLLRL